jgi:hypothetical protein
MRLRASTWSPSTARALYALLLAGVTTPAEADEPAREPTLLLLKGDYGPATLVGLTDEKPVTPKGPQTISVGLRGRYATIPDTLLDAFLLDHTSLDAWGVGLEVGIDGPMGSRWLFALDYTRLAMLGGNFRVGKSAFTAAEAPNKADYTEVDLHLIAIGTQLVWSTAIVPTFGVHYGIGVGLGFTPGEIRTTEVLPTCKAPVAECPHWQSVTHETHDAPWPVWPLIDLVAGFTWQPVPEFGMRYDFGFNGLLYTGMTADVKF